MRAKERVQHRAAAAIPSATELDSQHLSEPQLVSARYKCFIVIASLLCATSIAINVYLVPPVHAVVNLVDTSGIIATAEAKATTAEAKAKAATAEAKARSCHRR